MNPNIKIKGIIKKQDGFTLMELIVVIAILGLMYGLFSLNFASQKVPRNLTIAQNQLVTDIRKIQSYSLVSKDLPGGTPVQFYFMKFDLTKPDRYTIQAAYASTTAVGSYTLQDIQTIMFPQGVQLGTTTPSGYPITIYSWTGAPRSTTTPVSCALVGFKLPFAQVYSVDSSSGNHCIADGSNYSGIENYASGSSVISDPIVTFTLMAPADKSKNKTVILNGINGLVDFQ